MRSIAFLGVFAICCLVGVDVAPAQFGRRITPTSRIIQMQGYWLSAAVDDLLESSGAELGEPDADSPTLDGSKPDGSKHDRWVVGTLNLAMAADGTAIRRFAVIRVRAYHDADGGIEIFRKASILPVVNVRGRTEMLDQMNGVPDGQSFSLYGQFAVGSSELLVSGVEGPGDDPGEDRDEMDD